MGSRSELAAALAGTTLSGATAWGAAAVAATVALLVAGLAVSPVSDRWSYDEGVRATGRDRRIDLLRGVAICFVVVDHLALPSTLDLVTQEAIGPLSGAELFVALSGVVLGVVHRRRASGPGGWSTSARALWSRALKLYLTALGAVLAVWLVAQLPGVDGTVVTTFTDEGTGRAGVGAAGQTYDLYASFRGAADGTVLISDAIRSLLLLQVGPWQLNILGLYVVLLLGAPAVVALLLRRRGWMPVVGVTVAVWAIALDHPARVLPSQFEDAFPLLSWQLLFVLGLVAGWHREELIAAARTRAGRGLVLGLVAVWFVLVLWSWSNPYLSNAADVRLALVDPVRYAAWESEWFARTDLRPGRVLAVVCGLVAAYAFLTRFWRPAERALGRALVPLGEATLYVFVMHVFVIVVVDEVVPGDVGLPLGTLIEVLVLAILWVMVRTRFLAWIVPR